MDPMARAAPRRSRRRPRAGRTMSSAAPQAAEQRAPPPKACPSPRAKWTRRVPHPVQAAERRAEARGDLGAEAHAPLDAARAFPEAAGNPMADAQVAIGATGDINYIS